VAVEVKGKQFQDQLSDGGWMDRGVTGWVGELTASSLLCSRQDLFEA
jgi:hypothetical protein